MKGAASEQPESGYGNDCSCPCGVKGSGCCKEGTGSSTVKDALDRFLPIEAPWLRQLVANLWWIQLALIPVDLVLYGQLGLPGLKLLLIITPHVFVSVASLLAYRSFERLGEHVLRRLWERGTITPRERRRDPMRKVDCDDPLDGLQAVPPLRKKQQVLLDRPVDEQFVAFIKRLQRRLNAWVLPIPLAVSFAALFYLFYPAAGFPPRFPFDEFPKHFALVVDFSVQTILVLLVGYIAWRLIVIAYEVWHLAGDFDLRLQLQHPDSSGGLGPLGDLCFSIAVVWAVIAIYPSIWILLVRARSPRSLGYFAQAHLAPKSEALLPDGIRLQAMIAHLPRTGTKDLKETLEVQLNTQLDLIATTAKASLRWLDRYLVGVFMLTLGFAMVTFFLPLYYVHRGMARQRPALLLKLDDLGREIASLATERERLAVLIPAQAADTTPTTRRGPPAPPDDFARLNEATKKLDAVRVVYDSNSPVPGWPFDRKLMAKFIGTTLIPLTGVTALVPKLFAKLFGQ